MRTFAKIGDKPTVSATALVKRLDHTVIIDQLDHIVIIGPVIKIVFILFKSELVRCQSPSQTDCQRHERRKNKKKIIFIFYFYL